MVFVNFYFRIPVFFFFFINYFKAISLGFDDKACVFENKMHNSNSIQIEFWVFRIRFPITNTPVLMHALSILLTVVIGSASKGVFIIWKTRELLGGYVCSLSVWFHLLNPFDIRSYGLHGLVIISSFNCFLAGVIGYYSSGIGYSG